METKTRQTNSMQTKSLQKNSMTTATNAMSMTGWTAYAPLRPRGYAQLVAVTSLVQGTGLSIASTDAFPTTADVEYAPTWGPPL